MSLTEKCKKSGIHFKINALEIITLILVVLKTTNIINVSWWIVFCPILIPLAIYLFSFIALTILIYITEKKNR